MNNKTSFIISVIIHASLLIYIILPTRATYTPPKQRYMNVNLNDVVIEELPPPEPEPEKPKPKISEEAIQMMRTRVIPTPKPTLRPTKTPTKKPTQTPTKIPTKVPTKKPSPKPTLTSKPTQTPTEQPSPTVKPSLTPTPILEIVSFDYFTPKPAQTEKPTFDYGQLFENAEGMSDEDKNSYGAKLSNHLQRYWSQPRVRAPESRDYTTTVSFIIDRKGNITGMKVLTASGWAFMDETVTTAIEDANPAPALPATFPADSVTVRVPFVLQKK